MSPGIPARLVQITHPDEGRRVALVYENELHLLATYRSVYSFAMAAVATRWKLRDLLSTDLSGIALDYEQVLTRQTPWRLMPCFDHPDEPGRCMVSTAGPPWRQLGSGAILRGHGDALDVESAAELAVAYVFGRDGEPRRVGVAPAIGGRFPALGPELTLDPELASVEGVVRVMRDGRERLTRAISSGGAPLLLALASIEPDDFEAAGERRPGDAQVHFVGGRLFGKQERTPIEAGDEIAIEIRGLGRGLRSPVEAQRPERWRVAATPL